MQARCKLYDDAYVWLVDSQAVRSFVSFEHIRAISLFEDWAKRCHNGWLKLSPSDMRYAWFERLMCWESEGYVFDRTEKRGYEGSGDWWYKIS
jgi:hypothetical protein